MASSEETERLQVAAELAAKLLDRAAGRALDLVNDASSEITHSRERLGLVEARVAEVHSKHEELKARFEEDHKSLRIMERTNGEALIRIEMKLDSIKEGEDKRVKAAEGTETKVRSLEDWRTGLTAKVAVIAVLAAFVAAILTALASKIVEKLFLH